MKAKPLVILCWVQVVVVAAFLGVVFYNNVTRPAMQFDYSRTTGRVSDVTPGGVAEEAGLRKGDRVLFVRDQPVRPSMSPLLYARRGERIPVVVERNGERLTLNMTLTDAESSREAAFARGAGRTLWAINAWLFFPINFWMLALGIALLVLRGEDPDARLASASLICWAGGNFIANAPGMGALVASLPEWVRGAVFLV
ncbi:MAG: serine endoprotease DegS, partial [Acidobacteria bacterium]|nr:serine endoprotease DegS [Acidobacteriota bacterium]